SACSFVIKSLSNLLITLSVLEKPQDFAKFKLHPKYLPSLSFQYTCPGISFIRYSKLLEILVALILRFLKIIPTITVESLNKRKASNATPIGLGYKKKSQRFSSAYTLIAAHSSRTYLRAKLFASSPYSDCVLSDNLDI